MKKLFLSVLALSIFTGLTCAAQDKGEFDIRLRGVAVVPQESATIGVIGGNVNINNSFIPELDFTWFFAKKLFGRTDIGYYAAFGKHRRFQSFAHRGPSSANVNLGKVWLLPPTLTLQYHVPTGTAFKPYLGAGVNYTIFYGVDNGPTISKVSYKDKFAFAVQGGFDFDVSKKVFINVDVKKVFLSTDVTVNAANLTPAENPELAPVLANIPAAVKINPWLLGVGVGYRFK